MARERKFSRDELFQETKQLLLQHGYEGFTFSILADTLHVSRGALYKYFENKEDLITNFIFYEMDQFLIHLKQLDLQLGFDAQFDFLLNLILSSSDIQKLIRIGQQIPGHNEKFEKLHVDMYQYLQDFIDRGKAEGKLRSDIPNNLLLGYIFQSVAIPNHGGTPHSTWVSSIKQIIREGMFTNT
ncbi:TetR/AcrR family transcriptional regulator [Neobacillus sp. MM2021_6]|uniref:TetR/AcrR family transcriptional regulator n=1 Tax=Bacillaceae TaxID=186817 RepID=UPI00140B268F|nr:MULTISPECIES: TetR/AcrR family transcriptional regulator [Bacillaceae]MBO0960497.1 TetR/AcrR family transcriptional regulator [Neobacillus sp. MM2021_6]NHC19656.1 TetR/AcrR family transcriptional regulator [Bacillus sp. MM2020_4]